MKINKKDLASIIAEEATNAMLDEGFFDSIRNQINKLKAPPRDIEREKPATASKAEEKIDDKKVIQNAGVIMANHGADLRNSKAFKATPLFKKYIASEEKNLQEQTPFEKEFIASLQKAVKQGQITTKEIYDSIRSVYKSDNSLRSAIKGSSVDADETFGLSTIDRAETVAPGTKPEDAPLAADGDFEDFVSSTSKPTTDPQTNPEDVADDIDIDINEVEMIISAIENAKTEEELKSVYQKFKKEIEGSDDLSQELEWQASEIQGQVTDDQIEFEAPADFKLAQELPADSGGIQGSEAPKPEQKPTPASQDSEESTAAARPRSKAGDTEMDKTMPSKTVVDAPEEEGTKVDSQEDDTEEEAEEGNQFAQQLESYVEHFRENGRTADPEMRRKNQQLIDQLFRIVKNNKEKTPGYEFLKQYREQILLQRPQDRDFYLQEPLKTLPFRNFIAAQESTELKEQNQRLLKLAGILKD